MRIDRFLWWARIVRSRPAAQEIALAGHLRIDGRPIDRAHAGVAPGQVLSFALHGRVRAIRIVALPLRRGPPAEARACYEDLLAPGAAAPPADPLEVDAGPPAP